MQNFPEIVTFRITSKCNNNCSYCYGPKNVTELNTQKLKEIIELFYLKGVKSVVITGGEPLLRADIEMILRLLHSYKFNIYLDTSGDNFFRYNYLINEVITDLGIPFDVADKTLTFRQKANFDRRNRILKYYKKIKSKRPNIRIGSVVTKENIDQIDNLGKKLINYSIDLWKLYQFIPIGNNAKINKNKLLLDDETFLDLAYKIKNTYSDFFRVVVSPRLRRANAYFIIDPDGRVYSPEDNKIECNETTIGNIFDKDIVIKWKARQAPQNYIMNADLTFSRTIKNLPIQPVFQQILDLARPYYKETNSYVMPHIIWMIKESLEIANNSNIDQSILLPLIILHDVGYSKTYNNPFFAHSRVHHMKAGKSIARKILNMVDYPTNKINIIEKLVSIHDVWAFGDDIVFEKSAELGVFDDLHYTSILSEESYTSMDNYLSNVNIKTMQHLDPDSINHNFKMGLTENLHKKYYLEKKYELTSA